jgi:hypothetical protein
MRTSQPRLTPLKKILGDDPFNSNISLEEEVQAGLTALYTISASGSALLKALLTQYTLITLQVVGQENIGKIPKQLRLKQVKLSKQLFRTAKREDLFAQAQLGVAGIVQAIDVISDQGMAMQEKGSTLHPSEIPSSVSQIIVLALGESAQSNLGFVPSNWEAPYDYSNPIFKIAGVMLVLWALTKFG